LRPSRLGRADGQPSFRWPWCWKASWRLSRKCVAMDESSSNASHWRPHDHREQTVPGSPSGSGIRVPRWFRAAAPRGACPSLGSRFVVRRRSSLERELASGGPWRSAAWMSMNASGDRGTSVERDEAAVVAFGELDGCPTSR
jgi:hypothetical protein